MNDIGKGLSEQLAVIGQQKVGGVQESLADGGDQIIILPPGVDRPTYVYLRFCMSTVMGCEVFCFFFLVWLYIELLVLILLHLYQPQILHKYQMQVVVES